MNNCGRSRTNFSQNNARKILRPEPIDAVIALNINGVNGILIRRITGSSAADARARTEEDQQSRKKTIISAKR